MVAETAWMCDCVVKGYFFVARRISRFPPTGPESRSTIKPVAVSSRRISPLAQ